MGAHAGQVGEFAVHQVGVPLGTWVEAGVPGFVQRIVISWVLSMRSLFAAIARTI